MSRYRFTNSERWAVYCVHGDRCYLCSQPVDFQSMEVDHIIPESLGDDVEAYISCVEMFGLGESFELNSYKNWLPACRKCNHYKRDQLFAPVPIVLTHLKRAKDKAAICHDHATKSVSDRKVQNALGIVTASVISGSIDLSLIEPLIVQYALARPDAAKILLGIGDGENSGLMAFMNVPQFLITPELHVEYLGRGIVQIVQQNSEGSDAK